MSNTENNGGSDGLNGAPALNALVQYTKDLSFENPNAPRSLGPQEKQPNISLQVNVGAQQIAQSDYEVSLTIDAKDFSQAVDRVSTISADKTRAVKLNLATDRVTLSVVNPESGTATEELGANYSADPIEIGFNARYLLDITGQIVGKDVRFLLADAGSPTLIEDTEDGRTLYVLMPMRV